VVIADHGSGIAPENIQRIFDPYFTTKEKGSGLGLATCYSIVKNHDGYISLESQVNVGTKFFIYLPASVQPIYSTPTTPMEDHDRLTAKILVMDDEDDILQVTCRILKRLGYDAYSAHDGFEALRMYNEAMKSKVPFDLVIMDLTIPGSMGGKDMIVQLLQMDPRAKAIVSSGYSNDPVMSDYKKYGFSGVISKPFEIAELKRTIASILSII